MDEDEGDRLRASFERKMRAAMAAELMYMEEDLAEPTTTVNGAPIPGLCHPHYREHRAWLLGWIDGVPGFPAGPTVNLPTPKRPRGRIFDGGPQLDFEIKRYETMRIEKGWAPAPYVGRPYVYTWRVGIDSHGRCVAGEDVQLRYTMSEDEWMMRGGDHG